jgi:hypothetical protein
VSGTDTSARASQLEGFMVRAGGARRIGASSWMVAAFLVSLALAAFALAVFGTGERGIVLALRVTARWCFVLFWPAYAGSALAKVGGPHFGVLARHSREFGLAFAAALFVHVGLVLWIIAIAADQRGPMLFFWAGVFCTYALALFSLPRLRERLGPFLWRTLCTLALEYIALAFAVDFIVEPLRAGGAGKYPPSYLPFAVALAGGAALRFVAFVRRQATPDKSGPA